MKGNEKLAVYVGTFVFVLIGFISSFFISDILSDILDNLGILTVTQASSLVFALTWFIVCFVTYWGSTRWLEEGEKAGILSLMFFILWIISSLAIVVGYIAKTLLEGNAATITLDGLLDQFFIWLLWALSPAIAALLGVSNKAIKYS
ncbi:MAG: hypothetical protein ACFFAU_21350 [Candidatus Hodarchaeota archaeon]